MPLAETLWQNRHQLVLSFHEAILKGMEKTWNICKKKPEEPDFVASLVIDSTPLICDALTLVLAPQRTHLAVSSVFCHQSPKVEFGGKHPCELGDILFVYIHTSRYGRKSGNAILFQAKVSAMQPYKVQKDDPQLYLYANWPRFKYLSPSYLKDDGYRSVTPKTPHLGAQYLLIDGRPSAKLMSRPWECPVGCCMPDELLYKQNCLACELFALLIFRTGRTFDGWEEAAANQDWSQVVWDLLKNGIRKSFNRKNSGRSSTPRAAGDTLQMTDGWTFSRASSAFPLSSSILAIIVGGDVDKVKSFYGREDKHNPPDNNDTVKNSGEPERGVSVVLVETSEIESEG